MCGIFGVVDKNKIEILENILPHRGPDSWGVVYRQIKHKNITLFQSRLSIIGLGDQGKQPFVKNSNCILIFNGEIYNYKEIKNKLQSEIKISFDTETDTEILYESLCFWGIEETLEIINGIFAFAFYNESEQVIYIARDPLGIKPLYYYLQDNKFYFSSEIKVFFKLGIIKPTLKTELLGEYLANGWIYEPDTLFKNIFKLKSGHFAKFNLKTDLLSVQQYWDIQKTNSQTYSIPEIISQQTIADVPIGIYFSGGVDSSLITYNLRNNDVLNLNLNLHDSESDRVKDFQQKFNLNLHSVEFNPSSIEILKKLIYYLDEPVADPAVIPSYILALESRKKNRIVMMSGMGGDEIDTGYSRSKILFHLKLLKLLKLLPNSLILFFLKGKIKRDYTRLVNFANNCIPANYYSLTSYFSKHEIDILVQKNWFSLYEEKIEHIISPFKGLKKFFALDFTGFLSSHNLLYIDKASMAASVEVRVPLLDKNIVSQFFENIENKKYAGKKRLKYLLKTQIGILFKNNNKQGFRYPIREWIENKIAWNTIIRFFEQKNILNTDLITQWVNKITTDYKSVEMKLWCIYTLYLWMITFNVEVDVTV